MRPEPANVLLSEVAPARIVDEAGSLANRLSAKGNLPQGNTALGLRDGRLGRPPACSHPGEGKIGGHFQLLLEGAASRHMLDGGPAPTSSAPG